ncbi:hypothetical protein A5906_09410 [Bradyrhizobium sacchari]|nr:hypothetical protein A5906_09410 [Bradyrhizobium sacchari]
MLTSPSVFVGTEEAVGCGLTDKTCGLAAIEISGARIQDKPGLELGTLSRGCRRFGHAVIAPQSDLRACWQHIRSTSQDDVHAATPP